MMDFRGDYPADWKSIATEVKDGAGWRCVRCGHPHDPAGEVPCDDQCDPSRHTGGLNDGKQRTLTVHHGDGDKSKSDPDRFWFLLWPLCQSCHLQIQGEVDLRRPWVICEHSEWFRPYVAGWYAFRYLGECLSREEVEADLEYYLGLERAAVVEGAL